MGDELDARGRTPSRGHRERGYSWPPFENANTAALKHGAYRGDEVLDADSRTREIAEWIWGTQPVAHPADAGAVHRLARVYRRLELAGRAIDEADEVIGDRPIAAYASTERDWL